MERVMTLQQVHADFRDPNCVAPLDFNGQENLNQLVQRLEQYGFVVVAMRGSSQPESKVKTLATILGLGDPYIPMLYRQMETMDYSTLYSNIRSSPHDQHPGFSTKAGQGWHVDGLLDEIGKIKTTLLYCVRPAERGGETILFNAVAAFAELCEHDIEAANALLAEDALKRNSTIPGINLSANGPVFAMDNKGNYVNRYTDNDTCKWNFSASPRDALFRAFNFLRESTCNPRFQRSIRLEAEQMLIFRNDRVSHGRRPYEDSKDAPRHLIRALYDVAPA